MLRDYAKEQGWWTKLQGKPFLALTAKKDDGRYKDTISCEWFDGKGMLLLCLEDGRNIRFRNLAAVMAHMDGSRPVKRDVKRRVRAPKITHDLEGNIIPRKGDEDYKPIGADIVDSWSHIRAKRRKGKTQLAPVINVGSLLKPRAELMAAELESEGYDVTVVPHATDGACEYCVEVAPKIAARPKAAELVPAKRRPAKKVASKRPRR